QPPRELVCDWVFLVHPLLLLLAEIFNDFLGLVIEADLLLTDAIEGQSRRKCGSGRGRRCIRLLYQLFNWCNWYNMCRMRLNCLQAHLGNAEFHLDACNCVG